MPISKVEVTRKLLHLPAILIPLSCFHATELGWISRATGILILFHLLGICLLIDLLRFKSPLLFRLFQFLFGTMLRPDESRHLTGATHIFAGIALTTLLFSSTPWIPPLVLSMFIWADAAAAICGKAIGKVPLLGKSLEGFLACFATAFLILSLFSHLPLIASGPAGDLELSTRILVSLTLAVFELLPLRIGSIQVNDNLHAPVLTGLVLWLLA